VDERLGRVVGQMLDRHASGEPGQAVLITQESDGIPDERRLYWLNADVWRIEQGSEWSVCDGTTVGSGEGTVLSESAPIRRGWPNYWLQLVFPLRGHFWGRMGDDYFMESARPLDGDAFVSLRGTEDDREGHLLVTDEGFVRHFATAYRSMSLIEVVHGPMDVAGLFRLPPRER
jgi:hypothetical protein